MTREAKEGVLQPKEGVLQPQEGVLQPQEGVLQPQEGVLQPQEGVLRLAAVWGDFPGGALLASLLRAASGVQVAGRWETVAHWEMVAHWESGAEALAHAARSGADVVLCPAHTPDTSGAELAAALHAVGGPPVLVLGMFEAHDGLQQLLRVPGAGYAFFSSDVERVLAAAWQVAGGHAYLDPDTLLVRRGYIERQSPPVRKPASVKP